ncbi:MAG: hypothetical protein R3249_10835 [Nitriliruptorales bacterium]|nr:hypothetical protein [Nitriliruptorales bacterium]
MTTDQTPEPRPDDAADGGDDLLAHLRDLAAVADPIPEDVTLAARSAIAWLTMDAELAELTLDSQDDKELAGTRSVGTEASRRVTFEAGDHAIDLEVSPQDDGLLVIGQCSPATELLVIVHTPSSSVQLMTDELGRFRTPIAGTPLRIEARWPDGDRPIITEWLTP